MFIPEWLLITIIFIFGSIIGSFLNVVIYRLPVEDDSLEDSGNNTILDNIRIFFKEFLLSIKRLNTPKRSYCPNCNSMIRAIDNIPIISWFFLKGRCHNCKEKISFRYPMNEFLTGILFVLSYYKSGLTLDLIFMFYFIFILIIIFWIDFDKQLILNVTTYPSIIIGLLYNYVVTKNLITSIWGTLLGYTLFLGIYYFSILILKIIKSPYEEGIGGGDIKLAAMLGAWLGWKDLIVCLFFSFLIGSIMGIIYLFKKQKSEPFPFGPAMVISGIITLFVGNILISWYINFLGW